jgi:DNA-binding NarL/FixJ family response regulator
VVCDDAPGFRLLMGALLAETGVTLAGDGDCWADAERLAPGADVIVVDLWMPEFEADALARVRAAAPRATLAIVTALETTDAERMVAGIGVDLVLSKSLPPTDVAARIASYAACASS